ncbi:MAG: 3-deoxy-7-phosphoheptulonate synthase [Calditrichaeota bacterium]|nr:3-deoxy-7-phosphoheptulonate synthase [Calditrichota bacterium]RQV92161.1 MAG: 3-deoxy-7-phosphoheptulonate synthase [bacterium]
MVIVMTVNASSLDISRVAEYIGEHGARPHISHGEERTIIGVIGYQHTVRREHVATFPGVEKVIPISKPFKLVSREFKKDNTVVSLNGIKFGDNKPVIIAGPCSVESEQQILETAQIVKNSGAHLLRGGAFKPRSSPYSFQGLGKQGLKFLQKAREETGLYIVTEVLEGMHVPLVAEYADVLQIGARNMQNYELLKAVGRINKPVLLKRGMSATMTEFLMSAEYIISEGNSEIILCERGIRTFVEYSRNTLDLNIVPAVKNISHLPIIVDPSHGTGRRDLIEPLSMAALAVGADGLLIEVHPHPEQALSDADQTLNPLEFRRLMHRINYFITSQENYSPENGEIRVTG